MTRSIMARTARQLGRLAAVGAVAFLLIGAAPVPVAAKPNDAAWAEILYCMRWDGDPYYFEFMGLWAVGCRYVEVLDKD